MAKDSPAFLHSSSIYQVFVRNYSSEGSFEAALPALETAKRLGFDIVYLTPFHPLGLAARKGSLGSPYAIADYRRVDPAFGGEEGLRLFLAAARDRGLKVIMDVVFNHTSPDSLLAETHPEWFWKGRQGEPGPRVAEWSDVIDLDHSQPGLRDYLIETLQGWLSFGIDGFRCDVASMVPVDFWVEARRRCALFQKAASREPCLWLAESVHKEFVAKLRSEGIAAASDAELHEAFDLSYDYDGRLELEEAWAGRKPLSAYLHHLFLQGCMLPAHAIKTRFLENHDQERAAARFGRGALLRNWTLFAMLLDGAFLAYAGQERALVKKPSLFDPDPLDWSAGDPSFETWFAAAHRQTRELRAREPVLSLRELAAGLVLLERSGGPRPAAALLNLESRNGQIDLPQALAGRELLSGSSLILEGRIAISSEPLLIELEP